MAQSPDMRIGFIGLGTMGTPMATSLRAAGHEMFVNDLRPEAVAPHVAAGAAQQLLLADKQGEQAAVRHLGAALLGGVFNLPAGGGGGAVRLGT